MKFQLKFLFCKITYCMFYTKMSKIFKEKINHFLYNFFDILPLNIFCSQIKYLFGNSIYYLDVYSVYIYYYYLFIHFIPFQFIYSNPTIDISYIILELIFLHHSLLQCEGTKYTKWLLFK